MTKKILILENDEYFKRALEEVLKTYVPHMELETVVDTKEAFNKLISFEHDLCIISKKDSGDLVEDCHKLGIKTPFIMFLETPFSVETPNLEAIISKPYLHQLLLSVSKVFSH
mgnify:CR=1 FL=1